MPEFPTTTTSLLPRPTGWIRHWPRSLRRRVLFGVVYLAFLIVLFWGSSWLYLSWKIGTPITSKMTVWDYYYPELQGSGVLAADIRPGDDFIDVVMLGGSTIDWAFGDVEALLKAGLQREFGDRIRIYNLARSAHTSRDSQVKYSRIADKPFDLILIYDGFNDCRMNNCEKSQFRDDYTHCVWYNGFEKRRRTGLMTLPRQMLGELTEAINFEAPNVNYEQFGGELKTPGPFRQNLENILKSAQAQQSLVLLQTFAYHIPANYSDEKFDRHELGYGKRVQSAGFPLRMWGRPVDLVKGVEAHNQIVRNLAEQHPGQTVFVDQDRSMSHHVRYFVDGCHFTDDGCRKFVDNLLPAVVRRLREKRIPSTRPDVAM